VISHNTCPPSKEVLNRNTAPRLPAPPRTLSRLIPTRWIRRRGVRHVTDSGPPCGARSRPLPSFGSPVLPPPPRPLPYMPRRPRLFPRKPTFQKKERKAKFLLPSEKKNQSRNGEQRRHREGRSGGGWCRCGRWRRVRLRRVGDAEARGVPHPGDAAVPRGAEEGRAGLREAAQPAQERLLPAAGPGGSLRARAAPPGLLRVTWRGLDFLGREL
jgi:hypothetical protein